MSRPEDALTREQVDELIWEIRSHTITYGQAAERHTRLCAHDARQRAEIARLTQELNFDDLPWMEAFKNKKDHGHGQLSKRDSGILLRIVRNRYRKMKELRQEIDQLKERLEMDYGFDKDGNRVAAPGIPDGIACRDATIDLITRRNSELKQHLAASQARVTTLEEALKVLFNAMENGHYKSFSFTLKGSYCPKCNIDWPCGDFAKAQHALREGGGA